MWPEARKSRWPFFVEKQKMPAVSKAQFGFMGAVASGKIKRKGLSKEKAKEFLRGVHPNRLPKRKKVKKLKIVNT